MRIVSLKSAVIFGLIVASLIPCIISSPLASSLPDPVTVTSTSMGDSTDVKITNNASSKSSISAFTLNLKSGSFKSFQLENGLIGKKTSPDTISFTASNPLQPGDSFTFEIRTDQPSPYLSWSVFDPNNVEISSGEINAPPPPTNENTSQPPSNENTSQPPSNENTSQPPSNENTPTQQPIKKNPGILDMSSFRIIPSTPSPGFDVRVVGQSFAASTNLDLYVGDQKIDSFSSNSRGNFVVTTTVPTTLNPGNTIFVLKDQLNNQKTFTTTINPAPPSRTAQVFVPLSVNIAPIYHRGDTKEISGNATPGSTVTISILDSTGNSITTFLTKADSKGTYSVSNTVPIDRPFGKYSISVSDGKDQITKQYSIVSTHQISVSTSMQRYNPGDTVLINGTALSNLPVSISVDDPTGTEIFVKDLNVTSDGTVSTSFPLSSSAIKGTYVITATQGSDEIPLYFGVGVDPVPILTATLDKLNYLTTDKPILNISGPPSSTLNLVIVDPSDKEKFSDTISIGPDGLATYSFNLTSYTPGIYSAVLTRGNDKAVKDFAVGLQTGSGAIDIKVVKDTYFPGDNLIILGNSNPNTIIQLTLSDPNGIQVKSEQTFTDKSGIFSAFDFRIPGDGIPGTWKLDATSGINHKSIDINVKSAQVMTISLDKSPATYSRGDIAQISGSGAGSSLDVVINVLDEGKNVITTFDIQSTNRGDYTTAWLIPKSFNPGTYTIQAQTTAGTASTSIVIN